MQAFFRKVLLSTCLLGLFCSEALAGPEEHLPTPAALAHDVKFWESVFTKYGPDDCLFHDRENLSLVYFTKHLPAGTGYRKARIARHYTAFVQHAILGLADGHEPRNAVERRIVKLTDPSLRTAAYYQRAATNVRCQRGVDLQPSLARSKQHLSMIKRILAERHLPTDLAYLPHLESGYNVLARSRVGARGLWQLMPATARLAGLSTGFGHDLRTNPLRATQAAAAMLEDFHGQTASWPLAITAYNYGINGTMRAIKLYGNDYMTVRERHHTRVFGFAARNYYPSFLAVRNVAAAMSGHEMAEASPPQSASDL